MTQPLDPNDIGSLDEGPSEFGWGPGMFPPGIANGEGQTRGQDDFGENMRPLLPKWGDSTDNYARAVADRRTDPTDAQSTRDFEALGNPDRYGGGPKLVKAEPQPNKRVPDPYVPRTGVDRKP